MPSIAAHTYTNSAGRVDVLRKVAIDPRLRPISRQDTQIYYHAALAALVAGWDAYINNVVREFYGEVSNPLDVKFQAIYTVAQANSERTLGRFNTPNYENTRSLLISCTGYDPISDWVWSQKNMGRRQVRERLNEILQVRHSFAHGFSMPNCSWNESSSGHTRLTSKVIQDVEAFLSHLVNATDMGLSQYSNSI